VRNSESGKDSGTAPALPKERPHQSRDSKARLVFRHLKMEAKSVQVPRGEGRVGDNDNGAMRVREKDGVN